MLRKWAVGLCLVLAGCGTYSTPAAVQISGGRQMVGTATAAASGGTFHVTDGQGFSCDGTYDAYDTSRDISAPVICSDGRTGFVTLHRTPDLLSGSGDFRLNDGTGGNVAFGKLASTVLITPSIATAAPAASSAPAYLSSKASTPKRSHLRRSFLTSHVYIRGPRGGCYYINGSGNKQYVDRSLCG